MLPEVFPILSSASAVTDLVGTAPSRIYRHGSAPQNVQAPYITWFVASGAPENNLDSLPPIDRYTIQIDCWSASNGSNQVEQMAIAVRDAMEPHAHMTGIPVNTKDFETQKYRIGMLFDFWRPRDS